MFFNKKIFLLFLFLSFTLVAQQQIIVDKMVGRVGQEIITMSDIEKYITFFLSQGKEEKEKHFYDRGLEEIINHKVVYLEYSGSFSINKSDYEKVLVKVLEKVGGISELDYLLNKFGMNKDDFKDFVRYKIVYGLVINRKLNLKIKVTLKEIEDYYSQKYLPVQRQMKLKIKSMIELAPLIEKKLREEKRKVMVVNWIENLKKNYTIEKIF